MMFTDNNWHFIIKTLKMRSLSFKKTIHLAFLLVAFSAIKGFAQRDVITTQANQEIRCRILDETPTRFIYAYIGPKGKVLRNEIFKNLVKDFNYNRYDSDLASADFEKSKSKKGKKAAVNVPAQRNPGIVAEKEPEINEEVLTKTVEVSEPEVTTNRAKRQAKKAKKKSEVKKSKDDLIKVKKASDLEKSNKAIKTPVELKQDTLQDSLNLDDSQIAFDKANTDIPAINADEVIDNKTLKNIENPAKEIAVVEKSLSQDKGLALEALETKGEEVIEEATPPVADPVGIVVSELPKVVASGDLEEESKVIDIPVSPMPEGILTEKKPANEFKNYLKWRIGAKVGIGNILNNTFEATNAFGLYQEKLLKGWNFGADLAFFPMEGFGIGAVYTDFTSSNSATELNFINQITGVEASGSVSNKISRKFIGPAFFLRKSIDFKTFVVLGISPGMYLYSDKGEYNGAQFNFKGREFGAAATLGLDFLLGNDIVGRDIILSLEAGYNKGKINGLDYGDGAGEILLDNPILLDRVDFSIGLRFMRFPKYLKK